ncbi:MAG: 16S rRNA (cytosine(1402)-N(4))-methyltransferase RsmH, partial [Magnetococcales bacterium]|nr:16S rRNA (cytosine(1402)-N(4))-methyltransferase RsmH [Magnetococcales bacterium]
MDEPREPHHQSVLLQSILTWLAPVSGGAYLDATFGDGGHSRAILETSAPLGRVIALDRDPAAIPRGAALAAEFSQRLVLVHTPFSQLAAALDEQKIDALDGAVFDLGVSSRHLDDGERGFSFRFDGPLDMRMNPDVGPTAAELIATLKEEALADMLFQYGEERQSRRLARAIVEERKKKPILTTLHLASIIRANLPRGGAAIDPATRTFQALRIAVNRELEELETALDALLPRLAPGGKAAVISFHSLEDRIVKQRFRALTQPPPPPTGPAALLPIRSKPFEPGYRLPVARSITPSEKEIAINPRARSARLRV